jgi:uncharacterized protein YecT (DUF1311 family)
MNTRVLLSAILLTTTCVPIIGHAASFDCARASSRVERLICNTADVSKLDGSLSSAYKAFLKASSDPEMIRREQKEWLRKRDTCQDVECLSYHYQTRLAELTLNPIESFAGAWPALTGGKDTVCAEALQIAKATFKSSAFYLFGPPEVPPDLHSVLVLKPKVVDISGGDALKADPAAFDKLPIGGQGETGNVYWQKTVTYGHRLAVLETPFGWHGDTYSLFALGELIQAGEFLAEVRRDRETQKLPSIISGSWRPPLILQEKDSGRAWIIEVGDRTQFLMDWHIHVVEPTGITPRCSVQFRPPVQTATSLLPLPVRELARLLDQTMGPGADQGTLQPTASLREAVSHTWANVVLRPWALGGPYNTRDEVDAGLRNWSQEGATYRKVYQSIQQQYPLAGQALAEFYQKAFHRTVADAMAQSSYGLDIALRSHYAFHSSDPNSYFRNSNSRPNPWRNE